jgi:hypothetical protein
MCEALGLIFSERDERERERERERDIKDRHEIHQNNRIH